VLTLTDEQRRAVETVDRSVLVSAAAGSGKTAVLAQRCVYLVCDAPLPSRCNVDDLLVLTFTEAAAAEMRARVIHELRARAAEHPRDRRLAEQVAYADAAHISTVHAFCLWILRRWFTEAGLDPTSAVMDEDEARLLENEVLEELFTRRYAVGAASPPADASAPTGEGVTATAALSESPTGAPAGAETDATEPSGSFLRLVEHYGLGNDASLRGIVLKLARFLTSLPDPEAWLREATESLTHRPETVVLDLLSGLRVEVAWQDERARTLAEALAAGHPAGHTHAGPIRDWAETLHRWREHWPQAAPAATTDRAAARAFLAAHDPVLTEIREHQLPTVRAARLSADADHTEQAAREQAKETWQTTRVLFQDRLRQRYALFTTAEWLQGLERIAPYAAGVVELVRASRAAYAQEKRRLDVLDFADLERLAYDLLTDDGRSRRPSPIARQLQQRFAHVLVDEFQDINPIQEAIIGLVSREESPRQSANLFVVGDVKQCIYRFRLAEPAIFLDRLARFRQAGQGRKRRRQGSGATSAGALSPGASDDARGTALFLRANFRSRPEIIDAVNLVFGQLMRPELGPLVYDDDARLRAARVPDEAAAPAPVELHILSDTLSAAADAEPEVEASAPAEADSAERRGNTWNDPAQWERIEREAYLIGQRLLALRAEAAAASPAHPLAWRDCVVLLRAARPTAEYVTEMLTAMGIPAYSAAGGALLQAREVRDVLALLRVLDNMQQDIPLAAVLRQGLLRESLSEDELVAIRCLDRDVPFHGAVRRYAENGEDADLRTKLRQMLGRVERYRTAVRREPLAQVLARLYEESGYFARVGGQVQGPLRQANLLLLQERARQFGSFRRQGLHRFLRFLESLEDEDAGPARAAPAGESGDVVRIMSIHQSKGLEFPVVFVAGLGRRFNLGDRSGRIIFERQARLGLRVVDPERMIEYPSAAHLRAVLEIERTTREEELRILYVAMTRARDRLILVGTDNTGPWDAPPAAPDQTAPATLFEVATANRAVDWLRPALRRASTDLVHYKGSPRRAPRPALEVHVHSADEIRQWQVQPPRDEEQQHVHRTLGAGEALPSFEPLASEDEEVEAVLERVEYLYPHLAAASVRAVWAASEFKGTHDHTREPAEPVPPVPRAREAGIPVGECSLGPLETFAAEPRAPARGHPGLGRPTPGSSSTEPARGQSGAAALRGLATHRVLQHLDFTRATDAAGVASELHRLAETGLLSAHERSAVDEEGIAWFVTTPLAERIRRSGSAYRREFKYVAAEACEAVDPTAGPLPDDRVLVRGIVDGVLAGEDALEVVDFKTDVVDARGVPRHAALYRGQVEFYARALQRLWQMPVGHVWLVFLHARAIVDVEDLRYD